MPVSKVSTLAKALPGSDVELRAMRRLLIRQLDSAAPRDTSPLIGKLLEVSDRLKALSDNAAKIKEEALVDDGDEEFTPESLRDV